MNNLRMRTKLSIGFGLILLLTLAVGGLSIVKMGDISGQAGFVKDALIPQSGIGGQLDEQIRVSGLLMRRYASGGDNKDFTGAMAALGNVKTLLADADALANAHKGLRAIPVFVQNFPAPLAQYERSTSAIHDARLTMAKAIEIIRRDGPATIEVLNGLIDQAHVDIREAARIGDQADLNFMFNYLTRFNDLYDVVENLRLDIFVSLSVSDRSLMEKTVAQFAAPEQEFAKLYEGLQAFPEIEAKIRLARETFSGFAEAVKNLSVTVLTLDKADMELTQTYSAALKEVSTLVQTGGARNMAIATQVVDEAKASTTLIAVALAIVVLFGLVMTVILTRDVTHKMARFVDAADKLSAGQFDTRVDIVSADEIGQTSKGINKAFDVVVAKMLWYESILDAIPSPITVTDMNRDWTFINKATEEQLGRKRCEVLGRQCSEWGTVLCGKPTCPIERLKHGEMHHTLRAANKQYAVTVSYITDRFGKNIGHIELLSDVTALSAAQKKAESALSEGMHQAVGQLEGVMDRVGGLIGELSGRISHAENGSVEQAARMMETATAMEEMNSTVLEVARNATAAAQVSTATRKKATDGATTVREVVAGIRNVQRDSMVLKDDMSTLSDHAQAISRIMGVISDIADQTNLLALNAAIEAARAGEAGRGFAVVADEVRKLAEKTMSSTLDVSEAINSIQQSVEKSTKQVDVAVEGIENASNLAERSGEALSEIVRMVDEAADQVRAIAAASEEQSATSEQINRAIMQVNGIAGDTSQAMGEASQCVNDLVEQSKSVGSVMEDMRSK